MPKLEKGPPDRLTDEEAKVVMSLPDPWGFTVRFFISTGLRWGEGCNALRRDVQNGQLIVPKTKTKSFRRVPLSRAILEEIMRIGGEWIIPRQRKAPGGRAARSSSSFNTTIRRLSGKAIAEIPANDRKALQGLERFHVHQCRHTFGCRYIEAGGELLMLKEIMGHSSIEMTLRYARAAERSVREDAQRVHAVWESAAM